MDEAAEVSLVVELRDSMTAQPLARGRDSRSLKLSSGTYQRNDRGELRNEVQRVFAEWSRLLRAALDRLSTAAP